MNILVIEVLGHAAAVLTFVAICMYGYQYRNNLRRNVHGSRYLYRLILATAVVFTAIHLLKMYALAARTPASQVLGWLDVAAEYPSVFAQSIIIFYLLANKIVIERTGRPRRVLAIGAHPGEFELAAGATLAKMHDAGYELFGLVLSRGDAVEETTRTGSVDFLGIDRIAWGDFQAQHFKDDPDRLCRLIQETIRRVNPEIILTASSHDPNPDRQAVFTATLQAGEDQNAILCYESAPSGKGFAPALYVDVHDYVAIKAEALRQSHQEPLPPAVHPEQVRARLAYRGMQARVSYAEGFEVVRLLSSCLADL
jgi:LmbE family N-acetylglucosaminyl deacetylase